MDVVAEDARARCSSTSDDPDRRTTVTIDQSREARRTYTHDELAYYHGLERQWRRFAARLLEERWGKPRVPQDARSQSASIGGRCIFCKQRLRGKATRQRGVCQSCDDFCEFPRYPRPCAECGRWTLGGHGGHSRCGSCRYWRRIDWERTYRADPAVKEQRYWQQRSSRRERQLAAYGDDPVFMHHMTGR
jgi:hypothetical protein